MLHPFAPLEQTQGYQQLFEELEAMLAEITGFDAVSLQPNAGSQGEYAGLLAIRGYHAARGQGHRDICLIPISAHGTNPASAVMAGMKVVVVACDEQGNVDVADLEAKAEEHAAQSRRPDDHLSLDPWRVRGGDQGYLRHRSCAMAARSISMAPISMRRWALVRPAELGADVCHMNLHKTFCIPHGGGGPGMGPIGVKAHLAPYPAGP